MTASDTLVLSPLGPSSEALAGACGLFQAVFGQSTSEAAWRWKYLSAPGGVALNWVAHEPPSAQAHGDAHLHRCPMPPLGHVGCLVLPGTWNGAPALMAHLTDVMVHPSVRAGLSRGSVYGRLMHAMAAELRALGLARQLPVFAYGFPGRTPSRLGQRMGLYRPLWPHHQQTVYTHQVSATAPATAPEAAPEAAAPALSVRALRFSQLPVHPASVEPGVTKTAAYLRWRYLHHPWRRYRLWSVSTQWGTPAGWVVTSADPQPWVVDAALPHLSHHPHTWAAVVRALSEATGCRTWRSWRPAGHGGVVDTAEASLIVPGQFRVHNILKSERTLSPEASLERGFDNPSETGQPLFHPGDTDVF